MDILILFWHIFPYLEHMQLHSIISNQPTYSVGLPDYLPLKVTYVKNIFSLNALPFFPFPTPNILYSVAATYAVLTPYGFQVKKTRFIHHNVALDSGILHNDILDRVVSTVCKCKKHTQIHKTRGKKKAASWTSLKANTFLLKGKLLGSAYA